MITSRKQLRPLLELHVSDHMTDTSNRAKIGYGLVTLSHFWVICTRNRNFSMGSTRFFFLTLTFHMNKTLCCSRKYPYPSHRRFFKLNPPPLQKFHFSVILSLKKLGFGNPPSPLEFPVNLPWGRHGYFLELHITVRIFSIPIVSILES